MSAGPDSARSESAPSRSARESRPRRRFVIAVTLLFASINATGLYFIFRAVSERSPDVFAVEFVSARGDVGKARELVLRFDRPIVEDVETIAGAKPPASSEGELRTGVSADDSSPDAVASVVAEVPLLSVFAEDAGGELAPSAVPLPATVFWRDRRTLVLRPDERLPSATPFRLVLSDRVDVAAGMTFEGKREFRFHTSPLVLEGVEQTGYTREFRASLRLRFSEPVDPSQLMAHLQLLDLEGEELRFDVRSKGPSRKIDLGTREAVRSLVVALQAGLRATNGVLGLPEDIRQQVELTHRLQLTSVSADRARLDAPDVHLDFNNAIDEVSAGKLGDYIEIAPRIEFVATKSWSSRLALHGEFVPGEVYQVTVRRGLPGRGGTILTEDATRTLRVPDRRVFVEFQDSDGFLSPHGNRRLVIRSSNVSELQVTARQVLPNNLVHYMNDGYARSHPDRYTRARKARHFEIPVSKNQIVETAVQLEDLVALDPTADSRASKDALAAGISAEGIWFLEVHGVGGGYTHDSSLVAVTDLALTTKTSKEGYLVWATSIRSGEPIAGARISLWSHNNQMLAFGFTDGDGVAHFEGPFDGVDGGPVVVVAAKGDTLSYLDLARDEVSLSRFETRGRPYLLEGYEAFVFGDRGVYRPGDTLNLEAIVRDRHLRAPGAFPVEFEVIRPDGKRAATLAATLRPSGGVSASWALPSSAMTGQYRASVRLPGEAADRPGESLGSMRFLVEEFIPRRMRVSATIDAGDVDASIARFYPGDSFQVRVHGEYLAGMPAASADVSVDWRLTPASFVAPGRPGYRFGDLRGDRESGTSNMPTHGAAGSRTLDADGRGAFEIVVPDVRGTVPYRLSFTVKASDTGGRPVTATTAVTVDPAPFYLGVRCADTERIRVDSPARFECAVIKPGGEPGNLDEVDLVLRRVRWSTVVETTSSGRFRHVSQRSVEEIRRHRVEIRSGEGAVDVSFPEYGNYEVLVLDEGSGMRALQQVWVSGPGWNDSRSLEHPENLEIEVLSRHVRPGGSARLLVRSPFSGSLLLTLESSRIVSHQVAKMSANHAEFELTIPEHTNGNLYVGASIVRPVKLENEWAPHRAYGSAPLEIDFADRQLNVSLQSPAIVEPESESSILVRVTGEDGEGLRSEVCLGLVDEGILAWTDHRTPSPFGLFYDRRRLGVGLSDAYGALVRETGLEARRARAGGGDSRLEAGARGSGRAEKRLSPVKTGRVRSTVVWLGSFETDENGQLLESFKLPRFTGELRLMAVAHRGASFGSAEESIRVRAPVHLELGMPRFVAPGDEFVSAADVFNNTPEKGVATVEWSVEGPLETSARAAADLAFSNVPLREVELDSGAATRLHQGLRATDLAGPSKVRVEVEIAGERSYEEIALPVRPAAPLEVTPDSGAITSAEPWRKSFHSDFLAGTASRRLVLSPLPDLDLLGSLEYVLDYPHGCLEQTTSRALPLLYLGDLAKLLDDSYGENLSGIAGAEQQIREKIEDSVDRIVGMISRRGWMGAWPGARDPWHWGTVYATDFLLEARRAGVDVPKEDLDLVLDWIEKRYLRGRGRKLDTLTRAYALFVLARTPRREGVAAVVESMLEAAETTVRGSASSTTELSAEARFFLAASWMALGDIARARAALGEELPEPSGARELGGTLRSPARETAILLSCVLDVDQTSPWVPALVSRLKDYRVAGRWGNTQENAIALLALGKYARLRRREGSNYTATVRLGDREPVVLGPSDTRTFEGDFSGEQVRIDLHGDGRLYWFLVEEGVPADGETNEVDAGLEVRRRYLDGQGEDVAGRTVELGEVVIVELRVTSNRPLENLVITDLLPGGLEVENPRLGQTALPSIQRAFAGARDHAPKESWMKVSHLDVRDDRVLLYVSDVQAGASVYRYAARAVTRGDFRVPVVAAESMYDPGVFSRHGAGRLVIATAKP